MENDIFVPAVNVEQVVPIFTDDQQAVYLVSISEAPEDYFTQDSMVADLPQDALLGDYLLDYSGESQMTGGISNEYPTISDLIGAGAMPEEIQTMIDMQIVLPDHSA